MRSRRSFLNSEAQLGPSSAFMDARQQRALALIDLEGSVGLEVGPLGNPIVTRQMGSIAYVDHTTKAALEAKYRGHVGIDSARLVELDYVLNEGRIADVVDGRLFNYVIASHVIEHVPDLVGWLNEVSEILVAGGILSLIVPDKRYCFDYFRAPSTTAEMLEAYGHSHTRPTSDQVFQSLILSTEIDTESAWSRTLEIERLRFMHSFDVALSESLRAARGEYVDAHCWVFTPASFLSSIKELKRRGYLAYHLAHYLPTAQGELEFYVSLRRGNV